MAKVINYYKSELLPIHKRERETKKNFFPFFFLLITHRINRLIRCSPFYLNLFFEDRIGKYWERQNISSYKTEVESVYR